MYALEPEPEQRGRWRRLGTGALLAVAIMAGGGYGAQRFEPTRKLIQRVVQLTVLPGAPKPPPELPPRTEPLPPPPKREPPKSAAKAPKPKAAKPSPKPEAPSSEPVVGLDRGSFGEGGGGGSFQAGNTQLGEVGTVAQAPPTGAPAAAPAPQLVPARVLGQPRSLEYTPEARRLGIEGLIVLEIEIDERGRVVDVRIRKGLEDGLDRAVIRTVKTWTFAPATLAGRAIRSTSIRRARFELER